MNKKAAALATRSTAYALLILTGTFALTARLATFPVYASPARLYVDPPYIKFDLANGTIGTLFNVTVMAKDVTEQVIGFQVRMYFNDTIINVTRWYEPKWDTTYVFYGKTTLGVPAPPPVMYEHIEPDQGSATVGSALFPFPGQTPFTGNGKLCIITFEIKKVPLKGETYSCDLNIDNVDTYVLNSSGEKIPGVIKQKGTYTIVGPPAPKPPVARFTWTPESPEAGATVRFNASTSTPDGGTIMNYTWNFGDGTPPVTETDPITTHVYANNGTYTVTLTVKDDEGYSDTESKDITVRFRPTRRSTDVNGDGKVDMNDIVLWILAFGSFPRHPRWDERCDINYSGVVDCVDVIYILKDYDP